MSLRPSIGPTRVGLAWAPAILYMALIWWLSSLSLPDVRLHTFPFGDKGVHFVEYGGLAFLVAHAARRTWARHHPARTLALAVWITVLWGLVDEIHQAFVPGRSSEVLDIVADGAGAVAGALSRHALTWCAARLPSARPAKTVSTSR